MNEISKFTDFLTDEELATVAPMLERLTTLDDRAEKQKDFMAFVNHVWPQFIEGRHHKVYAEKLQAVADGKIKGLLLICRHVILRANLPLICFQRGLWAEILLKNHSSDSHG